MLKDKYMTDELAFRNWKENVIEHFQKMLGEQYLNDENLTFLLGKEKFLLDDFNNGETPRNFALLAWCDNNLQYEEGRATFLTSNSA